MLSYFLQHSVFKPGDIKSSSRIGPSSQNGTKTETQKTSRKSEVDRHRGKSSVSINVSKQESVMYDKITVTEDSKPTRQSQCRADHIYSF